jgi:hypothetical protein
LVAGLAIVLTTFSPGLGARFRTGASAVTLLFDAGTGFTFGAGLSAFVDTGLGADFFATTFTTGLTADLTAFTGLATGFLDGIATPQS